MRIVRYRRHEPHPGPLPWREAKLVTFVYDVPYLDACGVLPPFPMLNAIFSRGGGDGGMSPGATWDSFEVGEDEYELLCETLKEINPSDLDARYTYVKLKRAPEFDHLKDKQEWLSAVSEKYRESYFAEQEGSIKDRERDA